MTMEFEGIGKLPDEEAGCSVVSDFVRADGKSCMIGMPAWILANVMQKQHKGEELYLPPFFQPEIKVDSDLLCGYYRQR